jgi:Chaperone of endosialidase
MASIINASTSSGIVQTADTSGVLQLQTASTTAVTVDASQNVGIGTSSPSYKLDVSATSFIAASVSTSYSGAGNIRIADASTTSASAPYIGSVGNNLTFGRIGTSEYMRIDSSGNVGIGTSSPSYKLQVATIPIAVSQSGSVLFGANDQYGTRINTSSTSGGSPYSQIMAAKDNNGWLAFTTGASDTERMRIDSSGNVLVGTTSSPSGSNNFRAANRAEFGWNYYNFSSNDYVITVAYGTTVTQGISMGTSATSGTNLAIRFIQNGGTVGHIDTTNTATAYVTSSDYRLKDNVVLMTGALDKIAQLKPVTYTWKVDGSAGQGFIAHELQEIVPDCVTGEKDAVDKEGKPVYQGVDTSFLVATLTASIQELKSIVDAQAERIAVLETK